MSNFIKTTTTTKKLNYMCPKSFVIIFITYVYTIDIPTMGSQRQHVFLDKVNFELGTT